MIEAVHLWAYLGAFLVSVALAWVLTPLALRYALSHGLLDLPAAHKQHSSPVPYLGGIAIVVSFAAAMLLAAVLLRPVGGLDELAVALGLGVALSAIGLVDDLRGLPMLPRVAAEVGAGVAIWAVGAGVQLFTAEPLDALLTVAWIVGVTNAFNLLDNMDGLSAGVAAIAAASFLLLAALNGQFLVGALSAGVLGCAAGFLRHNYHPARIYMGDAGSLFLGFMLAFVGIKLRFEGPTHVTFLVPILVVGVAVFDTSLVVFTRIRNRRHPFLGGRDHVSHRLVFIGLPVKVAVGLSYAAAASLGWVALVVSRIDRVSAYVLAGLVATSGLGLAVLLSRVPVYEQRGRQHWRMVRQVAAHEVEPVEGAEPVPGPVGAPS